MGGGRPLAHRQVNNEGPGSAQSAAHIQRQPRNAGWEQFNYTGRLNSLNVYNILAN